MIDASKITLPLMKRYKFILFFSFIFLFINCSVSLAKPYIRYESNLKIELPDDWQAIIFGDDNENFLFILRDIRLIEKKPPITITSLPISELQGNANLINSRSMANWSDSQLAELLEKYVNKIKEDNTNIEIKISKIINSPTNKSIFVLYDTSQFRVLRASTLIDGIKHDILVKVKIPYKIDFSELNNDNTANYPVAIIPIFIDIVKSMQPAY